MYIRLINRLTPRLTSDVKVVLFFTVSTMMTKKVIKKRKRMNYAIVLTPVCSHSMLRS